MSQTREMTRKRSRTRATSGRCHFRQISQQIALIGNVPDLRWQRPRPALSGVVMAQKTEPGSSGKRLNGRGIIRREVAVALAVAISLMALRGSSCLPCLFGKAAAAEGWPWPPSDLWYTGCEPVPTAEDQIYRSRIFPVPDATLQQAVHRLEHVPVVLLDMAQAAGLFPDQTLDPEGMLRTEAEEAEKKAKEREHLAGVFRDDAPRFTGEAQAWRARAEGARGLAGKLQPYLVRGLVLREGTGGFSVYSRGDLLWVAHSSLGRGPVPIRRRPVVVFLGRRPERVLVCVGSGE